MVAICIDETPLTGYFCASSAPIPLQKNEEGVERKLRSRQHPLQSGRHFVQDCEAMRMVDARAHRVHATPRFANAIAYLRPPTLCPSLVQGRSAGFGARTLSHKPVGSESGRNVEGLWRGRPPQPLGQVSANGCAKSRNGGRDLDTAAFLCQRWHRFGGSAFGGCHPAKQFENRWPEPPARAAGRRCTWGKP
jgi:hypothetical protein